MVKKTEFLKNKLEYKINSIETEKQNNALYAFNSVRTKEGIHIGLKLRKF
jgi:hypothetical protein